MNKGLSKLFFLGFFIILFLGCESTNGNVGQNSRLFSCKKARNTTTVGLNQYNQAKPFHLSDADRYYAQGIAYYRKGNFDQAIADYSKAISLDPNYAYAYYGRGLIYGKQGNFTQALSDYMKAIKLKPNYAPAYDSRGNIYCKQGSFKQAIFDYTKAIELNPKDAHAYYGRAGVYYSLKEYDNVWADVHKIEKLGYSFNPAFINALKKASGKIGKQ